MKPNIKIGAVTIGFLITCLFFVIRNQNHLYDVRPEPLLIEFVSVSSFDPSIPKSGGWYGAADVLQTAQEGQLTGWLWPLRGYLRAYSSRLDLQRIFIRQLGIFRPDVESAKEMDSEYRFSGVDFKFDVATYGQIECVVWTDGNTQYLLWQKNRSKCGKQLKARESTPPEIFPFG